jgi:type II secretory pathway pseudopilin PulG
MNVGPPPLPLRDEEPSAFASHASNACLATPLIMLALAQCVGSFSQNHQDSSGRALFVTVALVQGGLFFMGAILGVLAIALAKPGQRGSVIGRAVGGLAIMGLLAAIAIPNFVRARTQAMQQRKESLAELRTAVADVRAQAATALTNSGKTSVDTDKLMQTVDKVAQNGSIEFKGVQLFLKRVQTYQHAYTVAAGELTAAKVLAASTLGQREQIANRVAVVQKFLAANDAFKSFLEHSDSNFRKEMAAAGCTPQQAEAAFKGFRKNWDAQAPLIMSIRETDDRLGHSMLEVLGLLDTQWDQWRFDTTKGVLRFEDRSVLTKYNTLMADIKETAAEQAEAQKRLAAVLSQTTNSF